MKDLKKICLFFLQNHYSARLWVTQKNIAVAEKLAQVNVVPKEEQRRNNK
jgi:hypothetical protein